MSGTFLRTESRTYSPQRTDSRSLATRKASVTMRIAELREHLRQAEAADAELAIQIEETERLRERGAK
jgi:hypothetical protein